MKRLSVVVGIIATVAFIAYHFKNADRRTRLSVDYAKVGSQTFTNASLKKREDFKSLQSTRLLVQEGSMSLKVKDLTEARKAITRLTVEAHGYVTSEDQEEYAPGYPRAHQTVRIPSDAMDKFIHDVESISLKIESKKLSTIDVTEEFIDVESRLTTKKRMEARYLEIIDKAKNIDEIMDIERQIGGVRAEIESMQARLNYLKDQSAMSTLDILMLEPPMNVAANSYWGEFTSSLKTGWIGVLAFIKGLATVWPLLIVTAIGVYIYRRRSRNVRGATV